jgi:hypothetical protein
MKKIVLGGAAFAALLANSLMASPATAADLPVEAPVYVARPAAIGLLNWTGFYVGANFGYAVRAARTSWSPGCRCSAYRKP